MIDISTIQHLSRLSRLSMTEEEQKMYAEQLSVIFDYMKLLEEVDTLSVPETSQVTGLEDVYREDQSVACNEEIRKKILQAFPEKQGDLLKVKSVFQNE